LLSILEVAAERLAAKFSGFHLPKKAISPFIEKYLSNNLQYLKASLQRNIFLLSWALSPYSSKKPGEIVLVDYGGGAGMCSLLAKEAGIGTVVYVDIYDVCCHDAQYIANILGLTANHYVNGDSDILISYLRNFDLSCNALVSYDTLEHIYDIDAFLNRLRCLSSGSISLMMASGANPLNFLISRRIMKLQSKVEFEGKTRQEGEDDRNPEEPLLIIRQKMIHSYSSQLRPDEVNILASRTRGMRREDIIKAVNSYLADKIIPKEPEHPTNTCDPFSGNWCERLLNPHDLASKLRRKGFFAKIIPGYYGSCSKDSKLKQVARYSANIGINLVGNCGLHIAPYYCVYAHRN
jgi:hypothetical protein